MLRDILLIIAIILTIYIYIKILFKKIINNKCINKYNGFDLAKEVTSNYNEINVIESKDAYINIYNIKRRIVKLTYKTYNAKDYFNLAISSIMAGYYTINVNKDKYLKYYSYIIKKINYLPKIPIIAIFISLLTSTIRDSKFSIAILIILGLFQYMLININMSAVENIKGKLNKLLSDEEYNNIIDIINVIIKSHIQSILVILILILRLALIIFQIY